MRVSTWKTDPGYTSIRYEVLLDGIRLRHCHTADEEERIAYVYARDKRGKYIFNNMTGNIVSTSLTGKITVRRIPNGEPWYGTKYARAKEERCQPHRHQQCTG